jgi:hypothetical protein
MLKTRTLLLFLLKASVIYALLSAPLSFYDETYGQFYRNMAGKLLGRFHDSGFVRFSSMSKPEMTHLNIGNYKLALADGSFDTAAVDVNTRILGYLPTILLIALVMASPVPWRRRLLAVSIGWFLVMGLVIFKQYIFILDQCEKNQWLKLTNYTGFSKTLFDFMNTFISTSSFTVPYFVVGIWLLVTFRISDLKPEQKN